MIMIIIVIMILFIIILILILEPSSRQPAAQPSALEHLYEEFTRLARDWAGSNSLKLHKRSLSYFYSSRYFTTISKRHF